MTMIIDGSNGLTFPDNTLQTAGVPAPGTAIDLAVSYVDLIIASKD